MKPKQKVTFYLILFFVLAGLLIGFGFYGETTKTFDFDEFSIEAPQLCKFEDISSKYTSENGNFVKSYRCENMDLTITSMNKTFIKNKYRENTGNEIDFGKSVLKEMIGFHNPKIIHASENITFFITNTRVNRQIDTDVAGIYNDDAHFIIVEGGDVEFIEEITNSIKIKNS